MSAKITDTFRVVKKTDSVSKKFPQKKVKDEVKVKADEQQKGIGKPLTFSEVLSSWQLQYILGLVDNPIYPAAKDVRDLTILRDFDLRCEYGPCIGISRLERWTRAHDYGLEPPAEVKKIIEEHVNDTKFTQCLWYEEELL